VEAVSATRAPTAVALASGALAQTGTRTQVMLAFALSTIALGGLALFVGRRLGRASRQH
jgi:hypothetical protein